MHIALLLHPPRLTAKLYLSQGPSPRSSQKTDDVTSLKEVVTVRVNTGLSSSDGSGL